MNLRLTQGLKVLILVILVIIISALGIIGWESGQLYFAQVSILYIPIAPSTAYSFLILSLVLLSFLRLKKKGYLLVGQMFLLALTIVFSSVVLLRWSLGFDWDIENIFIENPEVFDEVPMGRMSPLTALLFIIESFAIAILITESVSFRKRVYGILAFLSLYLSSTLLVGYLTDAPLLYGSSIIPVALPTATAFWLISLLLFVIIDFKFWPFSIIFKSRTESKLSRTFFPLAVSLLIVYTFTFTIVDKLSNPTLILALVLLISIPIIGFIIIRLSKDIGKRLEEVEFQKNESERRFTRAINEAPFPIMLHSDGKVIHISKAWTEISGYELQDIPTIEIWTEKAYGEKAPTVQAYIEALYQKEESTDNGAWEICTKDGDKRVWEFKSSPIGKLDNGQVLVSSMAVDVTDKELMRQQVKQKTDEIEAQNEEYRQINEELGIVIKVKAEQENKLNTLIDNLQGMVYHCDNDEEWTMRYVSKGVYDLCGYREEDLLGNQNISWRSVIIPEDRQYVWDSIQVATSQKKKFTLIYRIQCKDGTIKTVREQGQMIENNDRYALEGIITDISLLKEIEGELIKAKEEAVKNEEQFKSYSENSSIAIYTTDAEGKCVYANKKWLKIAGLRLEEALGHGWKKALHPEDVDDVYEGWQRSVETQGDWLYEYRFIDKQGNITWVEGSAIKLYNEKQELVGYLGSNIDITKRKNFQEQLIKAKNKAEESDRLKTEFINNMSHEIRTPMNGILGFSGFLKEPDLTPEKQHQFINIIQNSGKQLLKIIDDILEISRLGTKQIEAEEAEVNLNDLLLELFFIFDIKAKENNTPLYLKKGLTDNESFIITDKTKLSKVLSNLLENALKFTNEGYIELGYYMSKQELIIYVKDTGIGIAQEKQSAIFERFSQAEKSLSRKFGGLGLGLSIAKENTELIGGRISLKSDLGYGSTFQISIPYRPVLSDLDQVEDEQSMTSVDGKYNILIAEDEEINFLYLEILILKTLEINANIIHAIDGQAAINICKARPDIHLVFMDLKMPDVNGFEATQKIKKFRPNLPIVAQTAYSTIEDRDLSFNAGCDDFISKPIDKKDLEQVVEKFLSRI